MYITTLCELMNTPGTLKPAAINHSHERTSHLQATKLLSEHTQTWNFSTGSVGLRLFQVHNDAHGLSSQQTVQCKA